MEETERICQQCHAMVADGSPTACPACGGRLVARPYLADELKTNRARTVDHRGILLPPRHAVGGIITPR
jgi:hypothetical protein